MIKKQPFLRIMFLFFCVMSFAVNASAQIQPNPYTCKDSLKIQPTYPCGTDYQPVCGCDNITYRNICNAKERNGVNFYTDGPCESFDYELKQNPAYDFLRLDIALKTKGNVQVMIYDLFGFVYFSRFLQNFDKQYLEIPVQSFPNGLYIMLIYDNTGFFKVKKFEKYIR
jgi:hypothetical protein